MKEIWKNIKGYEGYYQVSNKGRVRSLDRKIITNNQYSTHVRKLDGTILKTNKSNDGYLSVVLYKDKKSKKISVHRLVAERFITNNQNKPQVNHKDGNKENNYVENLEWCTISENIKHAFDKGFKKKKYGAENPMYHKIGNLNHRARTTAQFDLNGNYIKLWGSVAEASRALSVGRTTIENCCRGKGKTAGGYKWKYV